MARSRSNFVENGFEKGGHRNETRTWRRDRKDQRFQAVEEEDMGKSDMAPSSGSLHVNARIPNPKKMIRIGPEVEVVNTKKQAPENSTEEELDAIKSEIDKFDPAEAKFIESVVNEYGNEFWKEKRYREEKGIPTTEKWIWAYRESYIIKRLGWANDRKLASEKWELFEKYLNLKLPSGIPEEQSINNTKEREKTENYDAARDAEQPTMYLSPDFDALNAKIIENGDKKILEFTPEQQRIFDIIKKVAIKMYRRSKEETKNWEGYSDADKGNWLLMMKGSLRVQYEKRLIPLGASSDNESIEVYIDDILHNII